jgi:hypothetical protein
VQQAELGEDTTSVAVVPWLDIGMWLPSAYYTRDYSEGRYEGADVSGSAEGPAYSAARLCSCEFMSVDDELIVDVVIERRDTVSSRVDTDLSSP